MTGTADEIATGISRTTDRKTRHYGYHRTAAAALAGL